MSQRSGETAQMDKAGVPSGGRRTEGAEQIEARNGWRAILRAYAERVWRNGSNAGRLPVQDQAILDRMLGPLAEDAVRIVEAYALGVSRPASATAPPPDFGSRLVIVLNGVEAGIGDGQGDPSTPAQAPHLIQSELWQILRKVRESAELSYSREYPLIELDRRIVILLKRAGPQVPADISGAVGVDKAQVSRSVKRLLELGLVERSQIRAPMRLTPKGESIGNRMLRLAELRNRELTIDVSERELADFRDTVEVLLERAMALYEQERQLAQPNALQNDELVRRNEAEIRLAENAAFDRKRIASLMMTLSAYFHRSGALAFKRLTGLSTFEAFVLSEIGMAPPIEWSDLVTILARDHSQAGRTIQSLMDRGLIAREGKPGRRHGRFYPTADGARLYNVIHDAGRQRSDFLLAPLSNEQRSKFLATFDKIRRNAQAQLERERTFAELDREA
ncbi:MAG TPA: MarR family transcriptional regulator [Croceibacterium sp.]|nr:MarR family transcriptional regulator [Croceibacterium sp.]